MEQFKQVPPALKNQYDDDRVLRSYLSRVLPADVLSDVQESLVEMGRLERRDARQDHVREARGLVEVVVDADHALELG